MTTKLYSGKSVIVKVVSANVIVALCVMIFLVYNNLYIKNRMKEKSYSNFLDQLGIIRTFFYTELNRIKTISVAMAYNSNSIGLDNATYNSPEYFANLDKIKDSIDLVKMSVPYNLSFHILLKNYNVMISESGSYSPDLFSIIIKRKYTNFSLSNEEMQSLPEGINVFDDFIMYVNRSNSNINVYAEMQKEALAAYMLQRSELTDIFYVVYRNDKPVIQSKNVPISISEIDNYIKKGKTSFSLNNGVNYSIIGSKDSLGGLDLTFVSLYPTNEIEKSLEFTNNYTLWVVVIFMVIDLLLILFQYKVYNPIKRLASKLGGHGKKVMGDEIDIINTALENLKETNTYMQGVINQTRDIYKIQALLSLMLDEGKEVDKDILCGLNKEFESFVTMFVLFDSPTGNANSFEREMGKWYHFLKVLTDLGNRVYVVSCDDNLKLGDFINMLIITSGLEYKAVCGISEVFNDVSNICTSYMQCVQALYNCKVSNLKNNHISLYDEKNLRVSYVVPSDEEKRLVNLVMSGNIKEVELFFDEFLIKKVEDVSYKSFKRVYSHLINLMGNIMYIKDIKDDDIGGITLDIDTMVSIYEIHSYVKQRFINLSVLCQKFTGDLCERIINYINKNLEKDLSVNTLAYKFDITPEYLSTYFKKQTGYNLSTYINNLKMEFAMDLLRKKRNIKISDVALKVGIDNVNTFIRKFKSYTGTTPAKYKETIDE